MKLLIWGDWQLESKPSADRIDAAGRSVRFAENRATLLEILDTAKAEGCTGMVHLGDLTEERNPDSATLTAAAEIFGTALRWGWPVYAIAGNHDGAIFSLSSSSFEALGKMHEKFHVFHEPATVDFGGFKGIMLPYLHRKSPEEIKALAVQACAPKGASYLFAHYAYAGVQIGAKNMVLPGDHLDSTLLAAVGTRLAFFGHIHKQQVIKAPGAAEVVFPGSPYACDFGERNDPKGFSFLDTDTGTYRLMKMNPTRRWVQVDWHKLNEEGSRNLYKAEDLVKITGEYGPGESPQEAFKAAFAAGRVSDPFYKTFQVQRAAQASKRGVVTASSGLQKALADYFADRWPEDPLAGRALESAVGALKASSPAAFDKDVRLVSVRMKDFLSHAEAEVDFTPGEPLLVCGENGLGKTNLIEAVLFALSGQVSKGLKMASLVRQGASKATVDLMLAGDKGEYRIRRTVSLNSKGAATHKFDVEIRASNQWTSLADGGISDTQLALARLVGATFVSMRAINFQFQRDPNPFIGAEPSERKAILAEILGLDSLGRAHKALNEDRLAKMRAKDADAAAYEEASKGDTAEELEKMTISLKDEEARAKDLGAKLLTAKAATETAVAEAGAVGSERNSLQALIDTLKVQADGAWALRKSKADAEAAYAKSRDDLAGAYASARDRAVKKRSAADSLPKLRADLAAAEAELARVNGPVDLLKELGLSENLDALDRDSAKKAKDSVDARLASRESQNRSSTAGYDRDTLLNKRAEKSKALNELKTQDLKECSRCHQPIDSAHAEREISELTTEIASMDAPIAAAEAAKTAADKEHEAALALETSAGKTAETAGKALNDATVSANKAIDAKRSEAKALVESLKGSVSASEGADKEAAEAEAERDKHKEAGIKAKAAHEKAMAESDSAIAEAEKQAEQLRAKAQEATERLAMVDARLAQKALNIESARSREKEAQEAADACAASIFTIAANIKSAEDREANAREVKARLEASKQAWAIADMASQALDPKAGLPVHLIDERLPALADAVNAYLAEFGSQEFSVSFSTRKDDGKETLDVLVDNGSEPRLDVAAYSGGQLDRVEFCLRMALGDLAEEMRDVRLGFSMMDEPGTHLDEERKSALIRMIRERASDGRCPVAVVVSHDRKMMGAFDRRLTVTKDGIREE